MTPKQNNFECTKIHCGPISEENVCILPTEDLSAATMKSCGEGKQCDVEPFSDPTQKSYCIPTPELTVHKYPGMACKENKECKSNQCVEGKCIELKENEICKDVSDCSYGLTCRKEKEEEETLKCLKPIELGQNCTRETDCDFNMGCYDGVCTEYFTINDGDHASTTGGLDTILSICKSGYYDEALTCQTLKQDKELTQCDDSSPCTYTDSKGNEVVLAKNCLCGYNNEGAKYCKLGSGDETFVKYNNFLKDYYLTPVTPGSGKKYNENCHIGEKFTPRYEGTEYVGCAKDIYGDETRKKIVQRLYNARVEAIAKHALYNADECVAKIEFPYYEQKTDVQECAKVTCTPGSELDKQEYCAITDYDTSLRRHVTLNDICGSPQTNECYFRGMTPSEAFYSDKIHNFFCQKKGEERMMKYPGESCKFDNECYYPRQSHKCENGKCHGSAENGVCSDSTYCLNGLYCSGGKCQKQKTEGSQCDDTYECRNDLICHEKKCKSLYYSLDVGESIKPYKNYSDTPEIFCKWGTAYNDVCVKISDEVDKDGKWVTRSEPKLKECKPGESKAYYYIDKDNKKIEGYYQKCVCGFNKEGKSYYPLAHNYKEDTWKNYYDKMREKHNSDCHTLNRDNCPYFSEETFNLLGEYKNQLINYHLFYGSDYCVEKMLSGNYIKIGTWLLGIVLALLI